MAQGREKVREVYETQDKLRRVRMRARVSLQLANLGITRASISLSSMSLYRAADATGDAIVHRKTAEKKTTKNIRTLTYNPWLPPRVRLQGRFGLFAPSSSRMKKEKTVQALPLLFSTFRREETISDHRQIV